MVYICRLCLKSVDRESKVFPVSGVDNNGVAVTTLVKTLVPEIYLGLSENPVLCFSCYDALVDAYSFRLQCLRSENLIGIFMRETHNTTPLIELQRVVNYWKNVYKTNRRDVSVAKSNLSEWFGLDDDGCEEEHCETQKESKNPVKLPKKRLSCDQEGKDSNVRRNQHPDTEISDVNKLTSDKVQIAEVEPHRLTEKATDGIVTNTEDETHKSSGSKILKDQAEVIVLSDYDNQGQDNESATEKQCTKFSKQPKNPCTIGQEAKECNVRRSKYSDKEISDVVKLTSDEAEITETEPHGLSDEESDLMGINIAGKTHEGSDSDILEIRTKDLCDNDYVYKRQTDDFAPQKERKTSAKKPQKQTLDRKGKANQYDVRITDYSDKEISNILPLTLKESDGITQTENICDCPTFYDCPSSIHFDLVPISRRAAKLKKHINCTRECDLRHRKSCKYHKDNLSKKDKQGPCEEDVEMISGTVESANSTYNEDYEPTTEDESVDDEIDIDSLLQQLQKDENLEKLGLMENTTNLQDSYVIKRLIDKKDNSFHYALIPKAVGQNGSAVEKSSLNEILVSAEKDSDNDEPEIEETNLQVIQQKDSTKDTTTSSENVKSVSIEDTNDHILPKIKEEPADEEMLKEISIELPIEDTSMTMTNTEPVEEKDPLDITVNQPEDKPMPFIRVRPVESLKQSCNLNDEPLPVSDSLNPVKPGSLISVPSNSVSEPAPTHPTLVEINEADVSPPELSPNTDIRPAVQDPEVEGSYIGPRPLFTKSSPPPLQLCVQKFSKPNLNSRSLLKSKSSKFLMTPAISVSDAEEPSESNHSKELPSFSVHIEMPVLSPMNADEQIEIKDEPLGYNDGDELDYFDKALSTSTSSEATFTENSNLSKLIADPPLTEDQFDVPEYVHINNVSFLNITKLVHDSKQTKEKKQSEPKVGGNSSSIRLPQSLSELLDADPNKSEPENDDPPELHTKSVDDDPTYDPDRDPLYLPPRGFRRQKRNAKHLDETEVAEEPIKKMRRSARNKAKKIVEPEIDPIKKTRPIIISNKNKCVLRTSFTSEGDYVNDHDYFISPYARNKMTSVRRKGGESCICLLCDLIHSASKHVEHMRVHDTKCAICCADFENVFILNMHVRKHTSHCRECIVSVTYSRYLHHAQTHNRTPGMSKIMIPRPPKLPILENDFLDDLEPKVIKERRKNSNENVRRSGRVNRAKKTEPEKIPDNKFCKPSSITLTELLKSSRPSDIKGVNTGAFNESFSKSNKLAKRKSYSGKRNKVSKGAKIDNQQKHSNKSKKCKAVEELGGTAKKSRKERSEIIESHVYAKDGNAGSAKGNKIMQEALDLKKDGETKDCQENKTAGSSLNDSFKPDKSAIEKPSINLTDDVAQKIAPVGSNPFKSASTKPSKPLTIKMENLEKVDDTFMKKNLVLVKANTLKSYIKRELQLDGETGFKLPNKILWKRRMCSKQAPPGSQDNTQQGSGTECVAVCTEKQQIEDKAKDSGIIEATSFVEMPSYIAVEQSAPNEKLARITESQKKLDLIKPSTVLKSSIDPQSRPNCGSPPALTSFSTDKSSAINHPFGIEPECSKAVATVELPNTEEKVANIRAYAKGKQISATSTSSLTSEGIIPSSCPNLKTPPPLIRVSAEKNTHKDPLALEPDNLGIPPIMDQIVSKDKVAKIKAYLRSNMKASSMNRVSSAGTIKLTDTDAQRGFKMLEKVPPYSAPSEFNAKESESASETHTGDKRRKEITKVRVYRRSINKPASVDICESLTNSSDSGDKT